MKRGQLRMCLLAAVISAKLWLADSGAGHRPRDTVARLPPKNDTLYKHATSHGIPHVLIELRQDLLRKDKDKLQWTKKIHNVLKENENTIKSFSLKKYGSYTF